MTRILPDDHLHALATRAVHAGQEPDPKAGAVMPPIYQTSTYVMEGLGRHKGYDYARTANPTREAYERNVASLERGTHGFGYSSGLAALDAVTEFEDDPTQPARERAWCAECSQVAIRLSERVSV